MPPTAMAATPAAGTPDSPTPADPAPQGLAALGLAALGVVYGDIGTSPLYTVKEIFLPATGVPLDAAHLVGAVSAIVWALMLVVTLKYVWLVLRADHHGEGGGLALTALAAESVEAAGPRLRLRRGLLLLGMAGAALFYGDSVITPAISVLGAMEGLVVVTPALAPWVLPASLAVLVALFLVQRFGTAAVGRWFGPVILLWFGTLAVAGVVQIARTPAILAALNPLQAWQFLSGRGAHLLPALGAIVLALTGAEALYADLGHFGRRPIQWAWCGLVLPALALNYLGQGALLIAEPGAIDNPFFRMVPAALLVPLLVLATLAAIIASQAVISGAYSMTRQAMQLGLLPRLAVRHTSARAAGQIYMPGVNTALMAGVVAVVLAFGSSSALAGAYGLAVTLTMAITTVLGGVVLHRGRGLPAGAVGLLVVFFLAVDALLVAGCTVKFLDGGWATLAMAAVLLLAMATWARGRARLLAALRSDGLALAPFVASLDADALPRCARTAVYPVADATLVPQALLHNLKHNQVLHARNILLTVQFAPRPWVPADQRLAVEPLGHGFWRVELLFGFMDTPDVPRALADARWTLLAGDPMATSWFLSRETVVPGRAPGMALWQQRLFAAMARRASRATDYFRLPDNAVVELGTRVQL